MVITEYKGETMNHQEIDKMLAKFGYRRLTGTVNKSKWLVKHQLPNKGFGMRMAFGPDGKLTALVCLHEALEVAVNPDIGKAVFVCTALSDEHNQYIDRFANQHGISRAALNKNFSVITVTDPLSKVRAITKMKKHVDKIGSVDLLVVANYNDIVKTVNNTNVSKSLRNLGSLDCTVSIVHREMKSQVGKFAGAQRNEDVPSFIVRVTRDESDQNSAVLTCTKSRDTDGNHRIVQQLIS